MAETIDFLQDGKKSVLQEKQGVTMIRNFEELKDKLKKQPVKRKVAVVVAQDEHTLQAVFAAAGDGLVEPVLLGDEEKIRQVLEEIGQKDTDVRIIDIKNEVACAEKACEMAKAGEVDCIMKGKLETGTLMKVVVNKEKGIRKSPVMSLTGFMESPNYHKIFAITDPALLTYPTKEQKIGAIENSVRAFKALGVENIKVAILAATENVNPKMPETVEADEIKKQGVPGAIIEGPISYDLAFDPEAAKIKGYESPVTGDVDLLVAKDIVAANIAAKSITVLGGGRTGGTVLGALVPILLVSRAATADDKYMSIVISALIGKQE